MTSKRNEPGNQASDAAGATSFEMHVALEGRTGQRWGLFERLGPVCLRWASRVVHLAQQAPHRALGLALVRVVHVYGRDRASPVTRRASLAGLNVIRPRKIVIIGPSRRRRVLNVSPKFSTRVNSPCAETGSTITAPIGVVNIQTPGGCARIAKREERGATV